MFPSSGLFDLIDCPFSSNGLCFRPHCLYKHVARIRDVFSASPKSSTLDLAGAQNVAANSKAGTPVSEQVNDGCLQELERINKEIETMKHQVEEEQRQLSNYQTVQAGKGTLASVSPLSRSKTGNGTDTAAYEPSPCSHKQERKYVVDNSKPRTDLEYDPLSNFSSDLSSYSSSRREQKLKNGQSSKRAKLVGLSDQKRRSQANLSRRPSPEPLDEWMEDDVLIIDIPPSPQKMEGQGQKHSHSPTDISLQGHELNKDEGPSISLDSALQHSRTEVMDIEESGDKCTETINLTNGNDSAECDNPPDGASETDLMKSLEPSRAVFTNLHGEREKTSQANLSHFDPPNSAAKTNPPQQNFPSTRIPGPVQGKSGNGAGQVEQNLSGESPGTTNMAESSASNQLLKEGGQVIVIESSSEDEGSSLDIEVLDSDTMEECYNIFMEENERKQAEELPEAPDESTEVEKVELKVKPQEVIGKKRVAHEAKHSEPLGKSRPQPQVLVPLRGPAVSQPVSLAPSTQQAQQRAAMLTASAKGAQAFISSASQKKSFPSTAPPPPQCPAPLPGIATVQSAYINSIPLGTAVIELGNNLTIILPDGAFPITASSNQVNSVLTPIGHMQTNVVTLKQTCPLPALSPRKRSRTTAPILIPALARKSLTSPSPAAAHPGPTAPVSVSAATAGKPAPNKRKVKQGESTKDKVAHSVRQCYINKFTEEYLKSTANINEAVEKALAKEKTVYNSSVNKLKYLSVAVNALKKLKNQSVATDKDGGEGKGPRLRGNIPLRLERCTVNCDRALCDALKEYVLSEEKLIENNYPTRHPEKPGCAILYVDGKKSSGDPLKRICCRCGATYSVSQSGKHIREEECTYHYGKGVTKKVPGGVETRYSCCEGVMGTPGCQVFKLHVHDSVSLHGFVSTVPAPPSATSCPGLYSLHCEMCYTICGLELSRVTVVNSRLQVVYDTFVRPHTEVIDYNTRFSGISEEDVKGNHTSLREVQEKLLSFIKADTILIGHGLETNLCALKLLHGTVVDTSVVFPHPLGPPHKLSLNSITAEHLRKIIQESVCGHDTAEDASACMELMLWKLKEDGKLKKEYNIYNMSKNSYS